MPGVLRRRRADPGAHHSRPDRSTRPLDLASPGRTVSAGDRYVRGQPALSLSNLSRGAPGGANESILGHLEAPHSRRREGRSSGERIGRLGCSDTRQAGKLLGASGQAGRQHVSDSWPGVSHGAQRPLPHRIPIWPVLPVRRPLPSSDSRSRGRVTGRTRRPVRSKASDRDSGRAVASAVRMKLQGPPAHTSTSRQALALVIAVGTGGAYAAGELGSGRRPEQLDRGRADLKDRQRGAKGKDMSCETR